VTAPHSADCAQDRAVHRVEQRRRVAVLVRLEEGAVDVGEQSGHELANHARDLPSGGPGSHSQDAASVRSEHHPSGRRGAAENLSPFTTVLDAVGGVTDAGYAPLIPLVASLDDSVGSARSAAKL
jgi:hypothetical protein